MLVAKVDHCMIQRNLDDLAFGARYSKIDFGKAQTEQHWANYCLVVVRPVLLCLSSPALQILQDQVQQ